MKDYPSYGNKKSKNLFRKKTQATKKSSLKVAITWIIMFVVALLFVQQRLSYIRTEKKVRLLIKEKEALQLSILPLKLEERYLTRLGRVEEIAQKKLYLQSPRKSQVISVRIGADQKKDEE